MKKTKRPEEREKIGKRCKDTEICIKKGINAEENDRLNTKILQLNQQIDILTKENDILRANSKLAGIMSQKSSAFENTGTCPENSTISNQTLNHQMKMPALEKVFKREDHFWKNTLPKLIEKNPEKVKFTLMDQNKELSGLNGKTRMSFLKTQFKNIIQNVIPFSELSLLYNFDSITIPEWAKLREELAKPIPDLSKIKVPSNFKETKISNQFTKFFTIHGEKIITNLREIRNQIRELVKVRNRMFKSMKKIKEIAVSSDYSYDKIDHIAARKKWDQLKQKGINLFKILKINKKDPFKEYTSEVEMTELEDEEMKTDF
ncbi:unnamed protein product [Moneuplotes crassus]|uniref:Uncharacterized protein n=1 Tax=Euplotes crassus TaxID=5936 RepID=A0AAD1U9S1_EUPCR|nr:unnamed protein product [Moneuplotes crassus]